VATVRHSLSTWRQPVPAPASPDRSLLVAQLAEAITKRSAGRLRIGIDGRTAAGKTSFGHELGEVIARLGRPVLRASLDDFKKPWKDRHLDGRESAEGYYRNAFDLAAITELLLGPAAPEGSGEVVLCLRDPLTQVEHRESVTRSEADGVLIVDGVFAFRPELRRHWDVGIWLEVAPERAIGRGVDRDADMIGSQADAAQLHRERYERSEAIYIAEADPLGFAHIIVDNSDFAAPRLLRISPELAGGITPLDGVVDVKLN
jgi:uridine kinase